jgi:hypothetical protein
MAFSASQQRGALGLIFWGLLTHHFCLLNLYSNGQNAVCFSKRKYKGDTDLIEADAIGFLKRCNARQKPQS